MIGFLMKNKNSDCSIHFFTAHNFLIYFFWFQKGNFSTKKGLISMSLPLFLKPFPASIVTSLWKQKTISL